MLSFWKYKRMIVRTFVLGPIIIASALALASYCDGCEAGAHSWSFFCTGKWGITFPFLSDVFSK